jgi:uridine kinase
MNKLGNKSYNLGIVGPSGSGKTTFCQELCAPFSEKNVTQLNFDHYYRDQSHLPFDKRENLNFDHPDVIDIDILLEHIHNLQNQQTINRPTYSFAEHIRLPETTLMEPAPVLILEGLMLFAFPKLIQTLDLIIYLDTPIDVCLARRIRRDMLERKRSLEAVLTQYSQHVSPMAEKYIIPYRNQAHLILNLDDKQQKPVILDVLHKVMHQCVQERHP